MSKIETFKKERESLNSLVLDKANKDTKRFFNLDNAVYKNGSLSQKQKELAGLSASLVLRCDDCISYHVNQCFEVGITEEEFQEVLSIGLIVGGSIVIPHLRRAVKSWDDLEKSTKHIENKQERYSYLKSLLKTTIDSSMNIDEKMRTICIQIDRFLPLYDWTGFYLADENQKELFLGEFVGEPTDHTNIAFGKGICGQAVSTKDTFLIDDVSKQDNYLSCSIHVKSEIVVPIIGEDGIIYGEIDIDSDTPSAFKDEDKELLEFVCHALVPHFEKSNRKFYKNEA